MNKTVRFWNPYLETLPREKLQELQLKKFRRIVRWAYDNSRFHRSLYEAAGVVPEEIRTLADVRRVPRIEKSMMKPIQRKDPFPYGDALCVPLDEVTEFRQTSGTTGQPVYQPDTWQDWEWWAECWAALLWSQGYRPHDRVFLPFGYNVFVAFWAGHYACEKNRMRGCSRRGPGHPGPNPQNAGTEGHCHDGYPHLRPGNGRYGCQETRD